MSILQEKEDPSSVDDSLTDLLARYPVATKAEQRRMSRDQRAVDNGNRDYVYAGIVNCININLDTS